jgi:radical SAM family RiPP maturation amino acid epimerase
MAKTMNDEMADCDLPDYSDYEPNVDDLGLFKRSVERWHADFAFRDRYRADREKALADVGLEEIDPDDLDILVFKKQAREATNGQRPLSEICAEYRRFIHVKMKHAKQVRDSSPVDDRYRRWRQRMINSGVFSQGVAKFEKVVHAPFAVELCRGCTVNCWFCGVDAAEYEGYIPFNDSTETLWREILGAFRGVMGQEFAQHGFCYWATEPFDNPDYEKFIDVFHDELGYLPQTTTAVAMRDPERTRRLLEFTKTRNAFVQRFSVTTKKDFNLIHEYFDPEELLLVELIPQFENRASPKATAGRTRKVVMERLETGKKVPFRYDLEQTGSIACVSGFLVNLPERNIRLITPCRATDRWPLGYRILAESGFETGEDVEKFIQECIEHRMPQALEPEDPVGLLHPDTTTIDVISDTSFAIVGGGMKITLDGVEGARDFADRLCAGARTLEEFVEGRMELGFDAMDTLLTMNRVFRTGTLRDPDDWEQVNSETVPLSITAAGS